MAARMAAMNQPMGGPMPLPMGFNPASAATWNNMTNMSPWPQMQPNQLFNPAQMMVPPTDPFFAAHQQAMMYAKQAYQMAVAQQAMAAAGEEWERGSSMSFGGSVYGGGSTTGPIPNTPFALGLGGGPGAGNNWSTSSMVYPSSARSMYGGAQSEYGGVGGGGGNWGSSRSVYGENFGPPSSSKSPPVRPGVHQRESGYFPPIPPIPQSQSIPNPRANPRNRAVSQPASPNKSPAPRKAPPPSSWKAGV